MAAVGPAPSSAAEDDFAAAVRTAQADINDAVQRGGLRDDVLRYPLAALSTTLGLFSELVTRLDAVAERLSPAPPAPSEEIVAAIERAVRGVAFRISGNIDRRASIMVAAALILMGVISGALGYVIGTPMFGEDHLRRRLANNCAYYNGAGTHLALNKDTPLHRPVQTVGRIASVTWFGGLQRQYVRLA
jgi:hypothetical protein